MGRKHDALVRLLGRLLRAAGYLVATDGPGTWEPRWDRPQLDRSGAQKRDADGNLLWDRARLDLRLEGGPEEPTTYGDVVVSQARADSWVREAAAGDGAAATGAAGRKRKRYPPELVPGVKLVPFSVEVGGALGQQHPGFPQAGRGAGFGAAPGLGGAWGDKGRPRSTAPGSAS